VNIELIRKQILATPLLQSMKEDMRQRFVMMLLFVSETDTVSRTEHIFSMGATLEDRGIVLLEGMVRVVTEHQDSKTIAAPDILGEVSLFTPEAERTATVEVVVGGEVLVFSWRALGNLAQAYYTEDEMTLLRTAVTHSAVRREANMLERLARERSGGAV